MSKHIQSRVKLIIENNGQTFIYRRTSSLTRNSNLMFRTNSVTDTTVRGHIRAYKQNEVSGLVQQGDRELRIAAASISFVPKANDTIVSGVKTFKVISVDERVKTDVSLMYVLQIRGVNDDT